MTNDPTRGVPAQQPAGTPHPRFPHLFSPLEIGPLTVKNRIVNSAHATGFAQNGLYTDTLVAYHRERARGGAAVINSQATSVDPDYGNLQNVDDRIIPWYEKVAEAVHAYGAKYFAELAHSGRQGSYGGSGAALFQAPSAVPVQPYGRQWRIPHELEPETIRSIIAAHADAARRVKAGGIDGIELHFAHGNLAEQFISPQTNRRTDEWGGPIENRLRFAREVLCAIREVVGRELVVGCRLTGAGLDEGSLSQLEMMEVAGLLGEMELLDYISVTMGNYSDALNASRNIPDMTFQPAVWKRFGGGIKDVVSVPVFLVGRVNHPQVAEDLIAGGHCDMVVMARALIADPELPAKAFAGQIDDIRVCVGAQDGCWGRYETGRGISCVQNATVGHEQAWGGELPPAAERRAVVVVGGGPAGLECARVAAERGHRVTLIERSRGLGGQLRTARRAPQREELWQIVEWLQRRCERAEVDVRLETEATAANLLALSPDVVVVATGAQPGLLEAPADPRVRMLDAWDVLDGRAEAVGRVLVFDELGARPGFSVAEYLAEKRHSVEVVTPLVYPGYGIESLGWRLIYQRLLERGVKFRPLTRVTGLDGGRVRLRHVYTNADEQVDGFDTIVVAGLPRAQDSLYRELKGCAPELHLIGDATAPRGIEEAVYDGHRVGRSL